MPHKVPQNIDLEDKVIGPLTLKQFIYLMVAGGIIFILKFSLPSGTGVIFLPLSVIVAAFFLALAFLKPGDRPFEVLLFSIFASFTRPSKRVWKKEPFRASNQKPVASSQEEIEEKHYSSMDLSRLAFVVDSGGFQDELDSRGIRAGIKENKKLEASAELQDTLAATEKPHESLKELMKLAAEKVGTKKKEPSIQEMASLKPTQDFTYEKLKKNSGVLSDYEEVLKNSKNTQEARFEHAQIHR